MVKNQLLQKIKDKTAVVGVIGLGYVGLPFAVEKAKVGFKVIGIDRNAARVDQINRGENYISDVKNDEFTRVVQTGFLKAETDFSCVTDMDVVIIAVPTPLDKNLMPDLQYIRSVSESLVDYLHQGQLVSLESTTYPGTTEEVMLPILEKSGLKVETDFFLAHSPERVDPGNERYTTKNTNKVVGGVGPKSLEVAVALYSATIEHVVPVSSAKAAELSKVFENTFRAVNIALVNEMMLLCDRMDLNVWEVLDAAYTKPFGILPFYPGPGVGGHCIPLDPHYLEWKAREFNFNTRFIALAGELNRKMPEFVRDKAFRVLNKLRVVPSAAKVLVLGVSYKKDIDDLRESPALEVINLFQKEGVDVVYHDPFVNRIDVGLTPQMDSQPLTEALLRGCDMVVITTAHSRIDYDWLVLHAKHVLDTRNATKHLQQHREKITLL